MGKHLRRKHSYVRVEDDHHGCIWTLFRMINHHPWHNVKKMLPYKKHKPHEKSSKSNGIKPEEEHEIRKTLELWDDSILSNSASVNSRSSGNGSASKRSIKARIRGLMKDKDNSTKSDTLIQEPNNLQVIEDEGDYDSSAPTLMSLLKANPKLMRSISRVDESRSVKHGTHAKHKDSKKEEDYVGVLELFNVDQDLFLRILDDVSPRKPRLVKSGTFPSRNPSFEKQPSKIEHKHNEVWPTMISNDRELRKAKSQGVVRSSSLTESLERHGYLFDSSSNKAIKKHLSKSLRLTNEKEFGVLNGSLQGRRSFSMSESSHNKSEGELKELRVDSPRDFESSTKLQLDEQKRRSVEEQIDDSTTMTSNCEANDGLTSVLAFEVCSPKDEIEVVEWPLVEDSILELSNIRDSNDQYLVEYYSEDLQYVKFVLDIAGIAVGENQGEAWHAENQPLDPALFDGIEVCCPFEPKKSNKEDEVIIYNNMSRSHRKVLFDLINEALIDVHERYYANCYPKALSYWCHVYPKMKGKSREVEEFVRECLSWRPELDPALDVAMAHDLSMDKNGWVNLQMDTEGVALELEDLIFNELLDEFVC